MWEMVVSLVFEFNISSYNSELNRNDQLLPEFRIIFINAGFNKSVNEAAYWQMNEHPNIFVASDSFKNPYFPGILKSILRLFIKVSSDETSGAYEVTDLRYDSLLQHNEKLGEEIKRYAFFDFYLVTYFIKPYLEYLAFSFKNIGNQVSDKLLIEEINYLKDRTQYLTGEIETGEAMISQAIAQKISTKVYQPMGNSIALLKKECEQNKILITKYKAQLKSSP